MCWSRGERKRKLATKDEHAGSVCMWWSLSVGDQWCVSEGGTWQWGDREVWGQGESRDALDPLEWKRSGRNSSFLFGNQDVAWRGH